MKILVKDVVYFAVGAAVGAGAVMYYRKKKMDILESKDEIVIPRQYKTDADIPSDISGEATNEVSATGEYTDSRVIPINKYNRMVKRYSGDVDPSSAYADPDEIKSSQEDDEYHNCEDTPNNVNRYEVSSPPYVIDIELFSEERDDHDKCTIYYYEDDDTLTDENEEIIQDVYSTVGDALGCFGERSNDPEVVYVRNERLSIDYEVIRLSKSYSETVLGIVKEEEKKRSKPRKRKVKDE